MIASRANFSGMEISPRKPLVTIAKISSQIKTTKKKSGGRFNQAPIAKSCDCLFDLSGGLFSLGEQGLAKNF